LPGVGHDDGELGGILLFVPDVARDADQGLAFEHRGGGKRHVARVVDADQVLDVFRGDCDGAAEEAVAARFRREAPDECRLDVAVFGA
jgi:hypothetical protein